LIDKLTVEEVIHVTGVDPRTNYFPRELDALDLRTRKNQYGRTNTFRTPARKLLLVCRMKKANNALFVRLDMNPGVRTQPFHLLPAARG
jgi:hypothetical protein